MVAAGGEGSRVDPSLDQNVYLEPDTDKVGGALLLLSLFLITHNVFAYSSKP